MLCRRLAGGKEVKRSQETGKKQFKKSRVAQVASSGLSGRQIIRKGVRSYDAGATTETL